MKHLSVNQLGTYSGKLLSRTSFTLLTLAVCSQVMEAVPSAFTIWVCGCMTWKPAQWQRLRLRLWLKINNKEWLNTSVCFLSSWYCVSLINHYWSDRIFTVFLVTSRSVLTLRPAGCRLKWENVPWPRWDVKLAAKTMMKMSSLFVAISMRLSPESCVWLSRRHTTAAGRQSSQSDRKQLVHKTNEAQILVSAEASFKLSCVYWLHSLTS